MYDAAAGTVSALLAAPLDEAGLIRQAQRGDQDAFERLVREYDRSVLRLAMNLLHSPDEARDVYQEAFLKVFRNLAQWRGDAAFSTWLFAVATNVYRTELKRVPATMLSLDEIAEPPDLRLSPAAFDDARRDEALRKAVLALPAKYRDAVLLFYFHEQDVPQAARTLKVPEGTLKARLFRGRELLRSKFTRAPRESAAATDAVKFAAQPAKEAP